MWNVLFLYLCIVRRKCGLLHCVTVWGGGGGRWVSEHHKQAVSVCQSAYQPVHSSLQDFSQPAVSVRAAPRGRRRAVRSPWAWPCRRPCGSRCSGWTCPRWSNARWCCRPCSRGSWQQKSLLVSHSNLIGLEEIGKMKDVLLPLTLFYSSCTLWLLCPWARCTSLRSANDKLKRSLNGCSPLPHVALTCKREDVHSQRPSGLWASGTSASGRQTPRPSPSSRITALRRKEERMTPFTLTISLYYSYSWFWRIRIWYIVTWLTKHQPSFWVFVTFMLWGMWLWWLLINIYFHYDVIFWYLFLLMD